MRHHHGCLATIENSSAVAPIAIEISRQGKGLPRSAKYGAANDKTPNAAAACSANWWVWVRAGAFNVGDLGCNYAVVVWIQAAVDHNNLSARMVHCAE